MDSYFDLIPDELKEIILSYIFTEASILDLRDSKLFDKFLYNINFWRKVFIEYELPVFAVTVKSIFNNEKGVLQRFTDVQLFNILLLEYSNVTSSIVEYNNLINGKIKYNFIIPIDY